MVSVWSNLSLAALGIFPIRLQALVTAWQAVEIPLAAMAGAWYYREAAEPSKASSTEVKTSIH
jgi:hypothetical protein